MSIENTEIGQNKTGYQELVTKWEEMYEAFTSPYYNVTKKPDAIKGLRQCIDELAEVIARNVQPSPLNTDRKSLAEKYAHEYAFNLHPDESALMALFLRFANECASGNVQPSPDGLQCPQCRADDFTNPYTDANGVLMRTCGRCMIQWREARVQQPATEPK